MDHHETLDTCCLGYAEEHRVPIVPKKYGGRALWVKTSKLITIKLP